MLRIRPRQAYMVPQRGRFSKNGKAVSTTLAGQLANRGFQQNDVGQGARRTHYDR